MVDLPRGADIEIIDHRHGLDSRGILMPNDLKINGQRVLMPADAPVIVHPVDMGQAEPVRVTLTLFASNLSIRTKGDAPEGGVGTWPCPDARMVTDSRGPKKYEGKCRCERCPG
jgi:hypothetical protein